MTTLADRLVMTRNRPAGFDWMRVLLAVGVVCWHTIPVSYGRDGQSAVLANPLMRPPVAALLGMFFALSGFLVAGSLERCRTMVSFAGLRIMRIFPALVVEVLLSAFILGPLLTHFTLGAYFSDRQFGQYLLNMLGDIHFPLPGVFPDNPRPYIVNEQLWTVPFELHCYEALAVLSILGVYLRRWWLLAVLAVLPFPLLWWTSTHHLSFAELLRGIQLVYCFLVGVGLFRFRAVVPWNAGLCLISIAAAAVLLLIPGGDNFAPIPLAYFTAYLGLLDPPKSRVLFSGDYSYGLFLYSVPIQQAIASAGLWAQHWYVSLLLGLPLSAVVAVTSWWLIEKPVLSHKGLLMRLEDWYLVIRERMRAQLFRRPGAVTAPIAPSPRT